MTTGADPDGGEPLATLGARHGSDKAEHGYLDLYADLFAVHRHRPVRVLEIGVGGFDRPDDPAHGGASLRMWRDYFTRGRIVGLDILDKHGVAGERIEVVQGSQIDVDLLHRLHVEHGPFDIVIDDGSHVPAHVVATFEALFPLLPEGAVYCIEDVQTSYWPDWGGRFRRATRSGTMALVKRRLDGLNHVELKLPGYRPTPFDRSVVEVRARHNVVAFVKGDNTRPSASNRPHPIPVTTWIREDLVPAALRTVRSDAVLAALDQLHLRGAAAALARTVRSRFAVPSDGGPGRIGG